MKTPLLSLAVLVSSLNSRKATDELYGSGAYTRLQTLSSEIRSRVWSEIVEFKPELGSTPST